MSITYRTSDQIASLPVDKNITPLAEELEITNTLFKPVLKGKKVEKVESAGLSFARVAKQTLALILLFVVLTLPQTGHLLAKILPESLRNPLVAACIKGLVLALIYMFIIRVYL